MKLANEKIKDLDTWFKVSPPKKNELHWVEGRSAKELARYMTTSLPLMPKELEDILSKFINKDSELNFDAEFVTSFSEFNLGKGEGRNHDAKSNINAGRATGISIPRQGTAGNGPDPFVVFQRVSRKAGHLGMQRKIGILGRFRPFHYRK